MVQEEEEEEEVVEFGLAKAAHGLLTRGKWVDCATIRSQMVACYASSTSPPPIDGTDEEVSNVGPGALCRE